MSLQDARVHLDEAIEHLTLEGWKGRTLDEHNLERAEDFLIAEDLERIDRQIGSAGKSIFWNIAQSIRAAYVEIKAARQALGQARGGQL